MTNQANTSRAAQLVAAFLASTESVEAANAQLVTAKVGMLASLKATLEGCDAIDEDQWTKAWAKPVLDALLASGRYTVDDKGRSLSATVQASNLKIAVIAITNDVEPEGDAPTSLKNFVGAVRPLLVSDNLIEASRVGAKRKDQSRKSTSKEAAMDAACFLVASKDRARAKMLKLIMAEYADAFDDWADAFVVEQDNLQRANSRQRARRAA